MKKYWLSWWHHPDLGEFELHSPWWISADSDAGEGVCAAIIAESEEDAKETVYKSYDLRPKSLPWRFCETRPDDWAPWICNTGTSRFPKAEWMKWPETISVSKN